MVDGEIMDSEYITKNIVFNSSIIIETPELVKNKVHGDKTVMVRLLQIYDALLNGTALHESFTF